MVEMTDISLDCRGIACPGPVLECRSCLAGKRPAMLRVLVDNEAARENVSRYLTSQGYQVSSSATADGSFTVEAALPAGATESDPASCPECAPMSDAELAAHTPAKVVAFITADTIGRGDDGLGAKLMKNFLATLPELGRELWRIVLVNGGVRLSVQDSPAIEELSKLAGSGVEILVCGTCLGHFGILEKKAVGETTNMLDVVTSLQLATKVIQV